ncbi:MAG: nucleotidyltransferase family protein, partial [Acidobacteriota bacterium]
MIDLLELIAGRPVARDEAGWRELLVVADRTLSTPLLRDAPGLPAWFRDGVEQRIAKNVRRRARLIETYCDASDALRAAGIELVLLKGFTHEADAGWDPALRVQCDIDLLCEAATLPAAERALYAGGFQFHQGSELSDNHGLPLLKPHQWQWNGDYFDPDLPVSVELHHTLWDFERDRISTPGVEDFWNRREILTVTDMRVPAFQDADRLATAALHLL